MARQGTYASTFMWEGKRVYCYGATPDEAKQNAMRKKTMLELGIKENKNRTTVEDWAKEWLKSYKKGAVSEAWYKQMEGIVNKHIVPSIGDKPMNKVTAADIRRLINSKSHFSESHQRKIAQVILQIFDSAVENDVIDKLPIKRIKTVTRKSQSSTRAITEEERRLTLKVADEHPDVGLFFLIMLYCGCRPGEVSRLVMSDYDSENQILHVSRARKADGSVGSPKTQSGIRDIPVPTYLAERLDKLNKKPNALICTSSTGQPITKTTQRRMWHKFKRWMDIANGAKVFRNAIVETTISEDLHPYCYRHTYCTDLQDAGVPITVAQRLMGHSDIRMTAQIYTHATDKSFEDAREKINALHK